MFYNYDFLVACLTTYHKKTISRYNELAQNLPRSPVYQSTMKEAL